MDILCMYPEYPMHALLFDSIIMNKIYIVFIWTYISDDNFIDLFIEPIEQIGQDFITLYIQVGLMSCIWEALCFWDMFYIEGKYYRIDLLNRPEYRNDINAMNLYVKRLFYGHIRIVNI
jgi:hypothetical protein